MTDLLGKLAIFPPNGLDRSLHVVVTFGLLVTTFFAETYGWTYAGLVVPGYLAAVLVAAPVTGLVMVGEGLLTHWIVSVVGHTVPRRTGAWSTVFGRERFFLYIIVAIIVRLFMEGVVFPWATARWSFTHARELYSMGLVLIPLLANAFWNSGLGHVGPRLAILTALSYGFVEVVLLRHTNYSLSRFQIANESTAFHFLDSPKQYLILLTGALLAARNNVLHGWDYNGILVPALLAVAWYQPILGAATLAEALVIYGVCRVLTSKGPLSRVLLVGPRKMLFVVVVGFALKMICGWLLLYVAPRVQIVDYLGFGFILPSLLAAKVWIKEKIGIVLIPTLQVSLLGFLAGNVLGFGLSKLDDAMHPVGAVSVADVAPATVSVPYASFRLVLADTSPGAALPLSGIASGAYLDAADVALAAAVELRDDGRLSDETRRRAERGELSVAQDGRGWVAITRRVSDPDDERPAPRLALRAGPGQPLAIVVDSSTRGRSLPVTAQAIAERLEARVVVLVSEHSALRAYDAAFLDRLASSLGLTGALVVDVVEGAPARLGVVGSLPERLNLVGLGELLGAPIEITWRTGLDRDAALLDRAPRLTIAPAIAELAAGALLDAPEIERWKGNVAGETEARLDELTTCGPDSFREPTIDELRLFGISVAPALLQTKHAEPTRWQRAVAAALGYRFARIGPDEAGVWALFEPGSAERRGNATWIVRDHARVAGVAAIALEVPAPRWESGTLRAALRLQDALGAPSLLFAGALPSEDAFGRSDARRPEGRHSFYQRAHELWLEGGGHALIVQGIGPEQAVDEDVVLSLGREVAQRELEPAWLGPLRAAFEDSGYRVGLFDGARAHAPFGGSSQPTLMFAERFAEDRAAIAFLAPALRMTFAQIGGPRRFEAIFRPDTTIATRDVARRAIELAACAPAGGGCVAGVVEAADCDIGGAARLAERLTQEKNHGMRARSWRVDTAASSRSFATTPRASSGWWSRRPDARASFPCTGLESAARAPRSPRSRRFAVPSGSPSRR